MKAQIAAISDRDLIEACDSRFGSLTLYGRGSVHLILEQLKSYVKEGTSRSPSGAPVTEPDFDQIAESIIQRAGENNNDVPFGTWHVTAKAITEALRQAWNARGAADIAQLQEAKAAAPPFPQAATYVQLFDRAIKVLDR